MIIKCSSVTESACGTAWRRGFFPLPPQVVAVLHQPLSLGFSAAAAAADGSALPSAAALEALLAASIAAERASVAVQEVNVSQGEKRNRFRID